MSENNDNKQHRLTSAYDRMLDNVRSAWQQASKETRPKLDVLIATAREKISELEELTVEEAEKIGEYLKRDLQDAADYLVSDEARELADWFKFDVQLIEDELLELFTSVADQTKLELMALQQQAAHAGEYHTGEITGIGTLACNNCGEQLHFHATGHIPPCPKCHQTVFKRSE